MRRSFLIVPKRFVVAFNDSILSILTTALFVLSCVPLAVAQQRVDMPPIPSETYYRGVDLILSGDFSSAAAFYNQELKRSSRLVKELSVGRICYYAMLGEACYQAGDLNEALKNYNAALEVATAYPNWLSRVSYVGGVSTRAKNPAPWGGGRRVCPIGVFPNRATITIGEQITDERIKAQGFSNNQIIVDINPLEILRCTALAVRRRSEILGPLAPFDPISAQLLDAFSKRAVAPNHWSVTLLDVIWGLTLVQNDKTLSGVKVLGNSLLMAGQYDHSLTGVALFELGNAYLKADKVREAAECYFEASISAYQFGDYLLVEEAIRNYSNASKALRRAGEDPVVNLAYRWAKSSKNMQTLTSSFGLELVEEFIYSGDSRLATSGLAAIDKTMHATAGRGLRSSRAADRWNYLNALLFYSNGDVDSGDESLAKVVEGSKIRSPWALQLLRLDNYVKGGLSANGYLTPRNAADLYEYLLREPTVVDWAVRPTESLAIQMIAPPSAYERWFCILFERDLKDKAFEVAERIRRERFFRTQTYGGRLLSLRYILTADSTLTTASIRAVRQSALLAFPPLEQALQDSDALVQELNSIPSVPKDAAEKKRQLELCERLTETSARLEAAMHFLAAGRVRIPYVFPPVLSVADVQKRLPPDTAVLSFMDAEGQTFGFMIGKDNLDAWRVGSSSRVGDAVATFLKTLGNTDGTREIAASDLAEARWKAQGARLREILMGASDVDADRFNVVFSKLVVVPDSYLWYLPFEALCLPAAAAEEEENADEEVAEDDSSNDEESQEDEDDEIADEEEQKKKKQDEIEARLNEALAVDDAETSELKDASEAPAVPAKRKSRSARQREALDAYEATLIPMIQVPDLTIRYSATVATSLPNALGRNSFVDTTLFAGQTYPREEPEIQDAAAERFAAAVSKTDATRLSDMSAIPGAIYAARLKRMVVWNEILGDIWNWEPLILGKSRVGNRASDWISCPWGAPRLIVLPALRTHAEDALKNGGDGSEIFLPVLAMQASGADAMLLSRWRVGGRSAYDLSTDFVKYYENFPVAEAWKKSVLALCDRDVVVEEEPRLRKLGRSESIPKYDSPFWWAGYLLIDSGEAVKAEELEAFDAANVQKADAENAILEDSKNPEGTNAFDMNREIPEDEDESKNDDPSQKEKGTTNDQQEEGVVTPTFVNPDDEKKVDEETKGKDKEKEDEEPFELGPQKIKDEDLARQDEEGDDFFDNSDDGIGEGNEANEGNATSDSDEGASNSSVEEKENKKTADESKEDEDSASDSTNKPQGDVKDSPKAEPKDAPKKSNDKPKERLSIKGTPKKNSK